MSRGAVVVAEELRVSEESDWGAGTARAGWADWWGTAGATCALAQTSLHSTYKQRDGKQKHDTVTNESKHAD